MTDETLYPPKLGAGQTTRGGGADGPGPGEAGHWDYPRALPPLLAGTLARKGVDADDPQAVVTHYTTGPYYGQAKNRPFWLAAYAAANGVEL